MAFDKVSHHHHHHGVASRTKIKKGSSTSPAGTLVADKADAGEACPVAVVAGEGLVWD